MNRDLQRRLRRLEVDRNGSRIRYAVSSTPWPGRDLVDLSTCADPGPEPSRDMSVSEWQARYCGDAPSIEPR